MLIFTNCLFKTAVPSKNGAGFWSFNGGIVECLKLKFREKKPINFATSVYFNISNKLCVYHLKCNTKFVELHFLLVNQTFLLHMLIMASNLIISITFCPLDIRYYLFLLITSFDWEEAPLYILKWYRITKLISLEYLNTTN